MKFRLALALSVALSMLVTTSVAGTAVAARRATVQKVTVSMYDFRFKLSKSVLHTGKTTFTVVNHGHSIHNFALQGVHTSPFLPPGAKKTFTVTLKKKGKFHYVCTVPRHESLGMFGDLTVK